MPVDHDPTDLTGGAVGPRRHYVPPQSGLERWSRPVAAVAAVVALVAGTLGAWRWVDARRQTCSGDIRRQGDSDQCVGLTDGSFDFAGQLERVDDLIQAENAAVEERAEAGEPWVTLVYLLPITLRDEDVSGPTSVLHEVEGAYMAQRTANAAEDRAPLIRLLLANTDSHNEQWRHVVPQIVERADEENIVAVVGLGESSTTTREMIAGLSAAEMPMVASVLTADDIRADQGLPGLVRVTPTNSQQVRAGLAAVTDPGDRVLVVRDVKEGDRYTASLARGFESHRGDLDLVKVGREQRFDSSLPGAGTRFDQITEMVCDETADTVFYAGRGQEGLEQLVVSLDGRRCVDHEVQVVTGDDASSLAAERMSEGLSAALKPDSGISVHYTTLAHSCSWKGQPDNVAPRVVAGPFDDGGGWTEVFGDESLDDGLAIMSHDAMLTAISAARQAQGNTDEVVTGGAVSQQLLQTDAVIARGASGDIRLDGNGFPTGKEMPIMRLVPGGVAFVALSSIERGAASGADPQCVSEQ